MDTGKVYQIKCNSTNQVYIGSTCSSLNRRLSLHKSSYKLMLKGNKFNKFIQSHQIMENNNFDIELLEECNKEELLHKERYYIENTQCINKNIPLRTPEEYRMANKLKKKEYDRLRYIINKNLKEEE